MRTLEGTISIPMVSPPGVDWVKRESELVEDTVS
jgi:hypothetical protein